MRWIPLLVGWWSHLYQHAPGTIVVHFKDITERTKLEDDLRFSQIGLRETQRMSKTCSWVWNVTENEVWHK